MRGCDDTLRTWNDSSLHSFQDLMNLTGVENVELSVVELTPEMKEYKEVYRLSMATAAWKISWTQDGETLECIGAFPKDLFEKAKTLSQEALRVEA